MEKKLYRVKVVLYVMAENESEARVAATTARFDIFECSARKAETLDPEWANAIPYNSDTDSTCAEIFTHQQNAARVVRSILATPKQHHPAFRPTPNSPVAVRV